VEGDQENKTGQETFSTLRPSQGTWARSNVEKARAFAERLANVFQPHPSENQPEEEGALIQLLEIPYHPEPLINRLIRAEGQEVINSLNLKKSSGYDLISGKILKELKKQTNPMV
jgi:hypothetical protein